METFKNVLILLSAMLIPLLTLIFGLGWAYGEGRVAMGGQGLLLLLAAVFALKRNFTAMGLYLAGIVFLLLVYPKMGDFESYSREGRISGQLSEFRSRLAGLATPDGAYPEVAPKAAAPLKLRSGHENTSAVYAVRLPEAAYLYPPQIKERERLRVTLRQEGAGWEQNYAWSAENRWPLLLYPGGTYIYEVRREDPAALVSSGTVTVPVPPDFKIDSGEYAYDRAHGNLFINCTHSGRQRMHPWWTR